MEINDNENVSVVILAAGMGKRMNDPSKAKVMALMDGVPLLGHVLNKLNGIKTQQTVVIVGHQKESVIDYVKKYNSNIICVEQIEQLGTGHAVDQARSFFENNSCNLLILCGDVPNLSENTLSSFIGKHFDSNADVSVLSTFAPNPFGYGRIIRDDFGDFLQIVEHKDTTENEKKVNEINSGVYFLNSTILFEALKGISNHNAQGEYYLTDIIDILRKKGHKVKAFAEAGFDELLGVNSPDDLEKAEKYYLKNK